jgi:DNA-binding XRE family transcriptional regulator
VPATEAPARGKTFPSAILYAVTALHIYQYAVCAYDHCRAAAQGKSGEAGSPGSGLETRKDVIQMVDATYPKEDLIELRKDLGLTQQEMANQLDMALRSYQAIEAGESAYRYIHRLAVERAALTIAAEKKAPLLAPVTVRKDAIELLRVGRATRYPEFIGGDTDTANLQADSVATERFRAAYAVVGELVLLTTALDHQLNHILIQVLHLADSPMLEAVIATLDINRKIEMLKARAKHISSATWKKKSTDSSRQIGASFQLAKYCLPHRAYSRHRARRCLCAGRGCQVVKEFTTW